MSAECGVWCVHEYPNGQKTEKKPSIKAVKRAKHNLHHPQRQEHESVKSIADTHDDDERA